MPCACEDLETPRMRGICSGEIAHPKRDAYVALWCGEGRPPAPEPMPSLLARAANATKAAGRVVHAAVTLHQIAAPAETVAARREACRTCDKKREGWCGVCGCALGAKQRLATESCPLGRWPKPTT